MDIFEQYGIKEVADVTIYSIHKKTDGSGDLYYVPALYLDTLKVSSVEKTAENVWATGGQGNSRLISWDYGKNIDLRFEDALCTPASLGLCWGGILSADWKDGKLNYQCSINRESCDSISRMEKSFYPKGDKKEILNLLPRLKDDGNFSTVLDGVVVKGSGYANNRAYNWNMVIESDMRSIFVVPDRFFDIYGNSYKIDQNKTIKVKVGDPADSYKFEIVYNINPTSGGATSPTSNTAEVSIDSKKNATIAGAKYLDIKIDNNDVYSCSLLDADKVEIHNISDKVDLTMFKGLDLWNKFDSLNEMIYFILTKYEDNIYEIYPSEIANGVTLGNSFTIEKTINDESNKHSGVLWCYINPKTMQPYADDYWFSRGESFYVKSFTMAPKDKKLKSKRICVTAGQFPGMYMIVGESLIRDRDTGEDERVQLKFPLCKIKSNQGFTLQADGDPTVFSMDIEVARPQNGMMMEMTFYEVEKRMEIGTSEEFDGSTKVVSE